MPSCQPRSRDRDEPLSSVKLNQTMVLSLIILQLWPYLVRSFRYDLFPGKVSSLHLLTTSARKISSLSPQHQRHKRATAQPCGRISASSGRTSVTYKQQRSISKAEMPAPNQYPEEPPKRQDALSPQELSPAMSSSPEAVFMDQLYLAILDVGMYLDSRIASKYRSRTATTFSSAMQMLYLLNERRWGVMLSSGVSMWDRDIAIELRHLANDHLCVIGIIFVEGKSFISLCLGRV